MKLIIVTHTDGFKGAAVACACVENDNDLANRLAAQMRELVKPLGWKVQALIPDTSQDALEYLQGEVDDSGLVCRGCKTVGNNVKDDNLCPACVADKAEYRAELRKGW